MLNVTYNEVKIVITYKRPAIAEIADRIAYNNALLIIISPMFVAT